MTLYILTRRDVSFSLSLSKFYFRVSKLIKKRAVDDVFLHVVFYVASFPPLVSLSLSLSLCLFSVLLRKKKNQSHKHKLA